METVEFLEDFGGQFKGSKTSNLSYQLKRKLIRDGVVKIIETNNSIKTKKKVTDKKPIKTRKKA